MQKYQIKANEDFIKMMKNCLKIEGIWMAPYSGQTYTLKADNKFYCSSRAFKEMSEIVSKKFLEENFVKA